MMGTIIEKIQDALDSKAAISAAIEAKGVTGVGNVLSTYAGKILSIVELKGETKTVTATTSQQTINPSSGKNGITQITVNPVTSSIDANIVAGNIKDGVSILGVTGDYQGSGGGGGSNFLMSMDQNWMGSHDGTRITDIVYENVTNASWDCGGESYMTMRAYLSDGTVIHTGEVGSYSINLNGRTMFVMDFVQECMLKGTKITLADNSEKNIEDITYDDELLIWDFDNGCLSKAKPIWIKKAQTTDYWFLNKYRSGKVLRTTGKSATGWGHRTFDMNKNKFIYTTESVSDSIFTLDGIDTHMSCERIEESCEYYNIITESHFNLFANRILTSCSLNNLYPIKDMKYVKDNRTLRNISDYDNIPQEWFSGLRLAENNTSVDELNKYVAKLINKKV